MRILDELKSLAAQNKTRSFQVALVYLGLGNYQQAIIYLEKAFDEHGSYLVYLKIEPYLDPLRADSRFKTILNKVGLTD